jgi:radical SAM protein with 4Fe4S-binding SPASM domain
LKAPAYVQFYPTLRCNLSCGFCFNRGLPGAADAVPEDVARMCDTLAGAGVSAVDILGGEPTLHPRLAELLREIARRGLGVTLSTNGRGDLGALERIEEELGPAVLRVGVSVNEAEVPERLRGYLARRRPMVKSVCTRGWAPPPAVEEHLARPGSAFFLLFRDAVSAADLRESLSFPEYLAELSALQRRHPRAEGVHCGFVTDPAGPPELAAVRCPAGTTKLSALPDGSVFPCYLLFRSPEFRLGNLFTDPFERIWHHPALDLFRSFRGNGCPRRGCACHGECHGGCPAVSLLVAGDAGAPDPRCVPPGAAGG